MAFHIGEGYDIHRLVPGRKLYLGGILIPYEKGLLGTRTPMCCCTPLRMRSLAPRAAAISESVSRRQTNAGRTRTAAVSFRSWWAKSATRLGNRERGYDDLR